MNKNPIIQRPINLPRISLLIFLSLTTQIYGLGMINKVAERDYSMDATNYTTSPLKHPDLVVFKYMVHGTNNNYGICTGTLINLPIAL